MSPATADQSVRTYRMTASAPYSSSPTGGLHKADMEKMTCRRHFMGQTSGMHDWVCLTVRNVQHHPALCVAEVDRVTKRHRFATSLNTILTFL